MRSSISEFSRVKLCQSSAGSENAFAHCATGVSPPDRDKGSALDSPGKMLPIFPQGAEKLCKAIAGSGTVLTDSRFPQIPDAGQSAPF